MRVIKEDYGSTFLTVVTFLSPLTFLRLSPVSAHLQLQWRQLCASVTQLCVLPLLPLLLRHGLWLLMAYDAIPQLSQRSASMAQGSGSFKIDLQLVTQGYIRRETPR